ncbi:MAG TPA: 1-(5-phosphoribosyl)-5-[(5-phosphoribosylamino)methylideneamino]imidazole-4-carboxamide isomerase [Gemmataceae bacterium]|nr:1-(5-phosphoribosyl)-5-[(5-phosphoribosylamino)methylideneamino]imidazole-4-carboxamide isomerase [Gemmataceae bacterium]
MQIFPAIDLRDGRCVRLREGDYARETVFGDDPPAMAKKWVREGATFLHVVDLDGAKQGHPVNGDSIRKIVAGAGVPCQLGGGLRSEEHIAVALSWGVERVILGTRALQDPAWLEMVARRYPRRIIMGIDVRDGRVAVQGWTEVSALSALDLARQCAAWPLAALVYTDIGRDGMLAGPNVEALTEMAAAVSLPVIASGGVATLDDIRRLKPIGVAGCIIGRALYEGRIQLSEAIAMATN